MKKEKVKNLMKSFVLPREKLIELGSENLEDFELLSLILKTGTKNENVFEISKKILNEISFRELINLNYEELLLIPGINKAKACEILALVEIIKRSEMEQMRNRLKLNNVEKIIKYLTPLFKYENSEKLIIIYVNSQNKIIKQQTIKGNENYVNLDPKKIVYNALLLRASGLFLAHNHPSGDPKPSLNDLSTTQKIKTITDSLDIRLLDHIIFTHNDFYSFKENGDVVD
jgi:DNA repair protein RadC